MKSLSAIIILAGLLTLPAKAQNTEKATASFQEFVSSIAGEVNEDFCFKLETAYLDNLELLEKAEYDSKDYYMARGNLQQLWRYLNNAAVYYFTQSDKESMIRVSEYYLTMPTMEDFLGIDFEYSENRPSYAYNVAAYYFNQQQYAEAIPFLEMYLTVGEEKHRHEVYLCLAQSYYHCKQFRNALEVLDRADKNYPSDDSIIKTAITICQAEGMNDQLLTYLDKALRVYPNEQTFLSIKGKTLEDTNRFAEAEEVYRKMLITNPNSLEVNKHLALNCYNQGVLYANNAIMEEDLKEKKNLQKLAKNHFNDALTPLLAVTHADPTSTKYNQALAIAYAQLGQVENLDNINKQLASLGAGRIAQDVTPEIVSYSNKNQKNANSLASRDGARPIRRKAANGEIPKFTEFARDMIDSSIKKWVEKDPYETASEFQERVTEENLAQQVELLKSQALAEYIKTYARPLTVAQFKLQEYKADDLVFPIDFELGQRLILPVPRENDEARLFERNWNGMSFENPQYCISDDHLALSSVTFVTPLGRKYEYRNDLNLTYTDVDVNVRYEDLVNYADLANVGGGQQLKVKKKEVKVGVSDVDKDVPVSETTNENTFALIIANENYKSVRPVEFAANDGEMFKEYCNKTLGLPEKHVRLFQDASLGMMRQGMRWITDVLKTSNGKARAIVYYVGHGIPDESTHSSYLLPTDADGKSTDDAVSLEDFHYSLAHIESQGVLMLLDACFSGGTRDGATVVDTRGVELEAPRQMPKGNVVIFSASQGNETAWPDKNENHGLFTYHLLKSLKQSEGNATLGEIAEFVIDNVKQKSIITNNKSQTPCVSAPEYMGEDWKLWTLK